MLLVLISKSNTFILAEHYKGGVYEYLYEATLESDLTAMVVYRAANGTIWIRPRDVFHEIIDVDGKRVPRFAAMDDAV